MHGRETVERFLLARMDGMTVPEAAARAGVSARTARGWDAGALPRSYTGRPWGSGRIAGDGSRGERRAPMAARTRSLYEPAEEGCCRGWPPTR